MSKFSKAFLVLGFLVAFVAFVYSNIDYNTQNFKGEVELPTLSYSLNKSTNNIKRYHENKFSRSVQGSLKRNCAHFKNGENIVLSDMADVWQAVYYQLPEDITCFKIHIKRITVKERQAYADMYGNFDHSVDWNRCLMEVKSTGDAKLNRRHFLMGSSTSEGIFENILIWEPKEENSTEYILTRDPPDQWRVVRDLLLMRDCHDGSLVIFSRYPRRHHQADLFDALMMFGESSMQGKMACDKKWDLSDRSRNII